MNNGSKPHAPATGSAANSSQAFEFELPGQNDAFRVEQIQEIVSPGKITVAAEVPASVTDARNLRVTIIPAVAPRSLFGPPERPADSDARASDSHSGGLLHVVSSRSTPCPPSLAPGAS